MKSPIFILGTGRCGTSTLQRIFDSIPNTLSLHEGDTVTENERIRKFDNLVDIQNVQVQNGNIKLAQIQIQPRVDFIKQSNLQFVESSPFMWPYAPAFRAHFLVKIIHLVRHPLHCVRSLYNWPSLYNPEIDIPYSRARICFPQEWPRLKKICAFWTYVNTRINQLKPDVTLKLEDLTTDKIHEILNKLNINDEFDDSRIKKYNASGNTKITSEIEDAVEKWIPQDTLNLFNYSM